jgi:hypothetical protein
MRNLIWQFALFFLLTLLVGCGGGNGTSQTPSEPSLPPPPTFAVSLSPASIALSQGTTSGNVQVEVDPQNGFSGTVAVTASSLPVGVTISPPALSLKAGASGTFTLAASNTAGITETSAVITGVSGSLVESSGLQLSVNGPPVPDPFHVIGGEFSHGFYDQARHLLFVANVALNEVDVLSGTDFSIQARVSAPQPWGIDQMADGNTLIIGTAAQQIVTLDENTLSVTSHPVPEFETDIGLFYPNVVALANGKVLIIGQEVGIDSNNILDGGQYLIEWDSINNTFQILEPVAGQLGWETDSLARSADHKWAVFSADQFYLYSSDSDTLTTVSLDTVNRVPNSFEVCGYAINADGTKIAVASAQEVTFFDRSFNVLGTVQIPGAFQSARTAVTFSPDGNKLLLQYDLPLAIEVIDANNYMSLGYYSGLVSLEDNDERLMAVDSNGRAFVGIAGGVRVVDTTGPIVANPANGYLGSTWCPLPTTTAAPLDTAEQFGFDYPWPNAGTSYYLGGRPAPVLSNQTQINTPASSTAGIVDIECIGSDGNTQVDSVAFSYGVALIGVSANLIPPSGNPSIYVFGFGFTSAPVISIGGQPVSTIAVSSPTDPLQVAQVHILNGIPNSSVGAAVSSANGSASLTQAMTYIPSASIIPSSGLMQVLYDPHRNLVYALKATEIDILNPATLQWQSPLPIPGAGGSVAYNMMALSPDGSRLAAASPSGHVAVIDPDNPSQASVVATNATPGISIAISKYNKAILTGNPNVEVDLSSLKVTPILQIMGALVRASADGSHLYGADLDATSGQTYSIDPVTYSVQQPLEFADLFHSDLAVSSDGTQFVGITGAFDAVGDIVSFYNSSMNILNFTVYPFVSPPDDSQVIGSSFSPAGKVVVAPLGDSIEFWDVATGTLRGRLMTPEELNVFAPPQVSLAPQIALDATGQTIFAVSVSGLTVMKLPEPIDNLPLGQWGIYRGTAARSQDFPGSVTARIRAMRDNKVKLKAR